MGYGAIASMLIEMDKPIRGYHQPTLQFEGQTFPNTHVETQIIESAIENLGIEATHTVIEGQETIF